MADTTNDERGAKPDRWDRSDHHGSSRHGTDVDQHAHHIRDDSAEHRAGKPKPRDDLGIAGGHTRDPRRR
jgi:hypothetical protein